jgi:NAD+ synthase
MLKSPAETKARVVEWIRRFFAESLPQADAVVGISGGKDSSCVAALCAEALGKERVLGVLMPQDTQSDIEDSRRVVKHLGIRPVEINIGETARAFRRAFAESEAFASLTGSGELRGEAAVNFPARLRMAVLYAAAQSLPRGGLVANTCNYSEDYVGYATKFGDGAGDFSPLAAFTVEEVRQLGTAAGLPADLVTKTPADGLSGKSDEDKLGFTYAVLDRYIRTGVCEDAAVKARIDRLHRANLHKLRPMPRYEKCAEDSL